MHQSEEGAPSTLSVSEIRARLEGRPLHEDSPHQETHLNGGRRLVSRENARCGVSAPLCRPSVSSLHERPPLAPKPRNRESVGSSGQITAEITTGLRNSGAAVQPFQPTLSSPPPPPVPLRKFSTLHVHHDEGSTLGSSVSPSNVRSAAAHFETLISSGRLAAPNSGLRDVDLQLGLPADEQSVRRPPSTTTDTTSWSDLRNVSSCESSDEAQDGNGDDTFDSGFGCGPPPDEVFSDKSNRTQRKFSIFGDGQRHADAIEELKNREIFRKNNNFRKSEGHHYTPKSNAGVLPLDVGKVRPYSAKKSRDITSEPLKLDESGEGFLQMRHRSDANGVARPSGLAINGDGAVRDAGQPGVTSVENLSNDVIAYDTGNQAEDVRLKKLHYAAREILTVEAKFVEQLELVAEKFPQFVSEYGKEHDVDILAAGPNGQSHVISQVAVQMLMIKEAHKVLLEKFASKLAVWDSRRPDMAECLKNNAGFLKYCLPYLKEKKKFADEFARQLQENPLLAQATAKFEEQATSKISIVQQLDIVHQNVVRYTILLEAYKKYLIPTSRELKECEEAIVELSKVSEAVNHQVSLAEMEKRLIDLYRRLEGKFNVFEANRHLLHEGELLKQSRKDVQPRYLILFSDVLLICKYSRAPTLGSDCFQPEFYQFQILGIRVKAEEHGDYDTHFQLLSTKKSAVFIAKTKRDRDDWVKRLNAAKADAKRLHQNAVGSRSKIPVRRSSIGSSQCASPEDVRIPEKDLSDNDVSPTMLHVSEKYVAPWIPDPKATSCMMAGCSTKFNMLNRRHHCRQCGWIICRLCVGYAPVKNSSSARDKVCPECYELISAKYRKKEGSQTKAKPKEETLFVAPPGGIRYKLALPARSDNGIVSGTVFLRNKRVGETEKWGRLVRHDDGAMVLHFFDAEFDSEPFARHVLLGFELCESELDEGGRLFELRHLNQVKGNTISIAFRVAHSGNAERWSQALCEGLNAFSNGNLRGSVHSAG